MPTLLQINSVANTGSTGHIAEDIGKFALGHGWKSYIAYGRKALTSESRLIRIGNKLDILWHVFVTRMFDLHGLASLHATKKFLRQVKKIKPDVIHLHNIHGYYLNYKVLFKYLAKSGVPVVWTMHDCWAVTGHCPLCVKKVEETGKKIYTNACRERAEKLYGKTERFEEYMHLYNKVICKMWGTLVK